MGKKSAAFLSPRVSPVVESFNLATVVPMSPAWRSLTASPFFPASPEYAGARSLRAAVEIVERSVVLQHPGHDFKICDAAGEGVGKRLKNEN